MRKLLLVSLLSFILTGCGTIEDRAQNQMMQTLKEMANDPSSVEICDVDIVLSTDSTALLNCTFRANNVFGVKVRTKIEYIYSIGEENTYECIRDLSQKKSSVQIARESFDKLGYDTYGTETTPSFVEYLETLVRIDAIFSGRKVK